MAIEADRLAKVLRGLRAKGLAVGGCGDPVQELGSNSTLHLLDKEEIRLDWEQAPTPQELAEADVTLPTIDLAEKEVKEVTEVAAEVVALPTKDRDKLIDLVVADHIRRFPGFAKEHGINIDGTKSKEA